MPDHVTSLRMSLLRPDDLLVLEFEFFNLRLDQDSNPDPSQARAPSLVRADPSGPAFIAVHFSPQHIAEQVFPADASGSPVNLSAPPISSVLAGPSRNRRPQMGAGTAPALKTSA